jgi:zinc transporter, ZIP family
MTLGSQDVALIVASGAGTAIGGVGVLALRRPSARTVDVLLGFTAGIMLAASVFSLLVPALDRGGVAEVVAGFALGAAVLTGLDTIVPHVHAALREQGRIASDLSDERRRGWLLLSALTIHNVPEGLAVGVAFAAGGPELGVPIAVAIGVQNVPEGFVAAAPLLEAGTRRGRAAAFAAATGAVEPPAAFAAFGAVSAAAAILPAGLGFAAGAMVYVVVDELVPESHAHGHERAASLALLVGFALMMVLDNALG